MIFANTLAHKIILDITAVVAWLVMVYTMRNNKYGFRSWLTLVGCMTVLVLTAYVVLGWHPEYFHCTQNCSPWGN